MAAFSDTAGRPELIKVNGADVSFSAGVAQKLAEGWRLQGGAASHGGNNTQAMVR